MANKNNSAWEGVSGDAETNSNKSNFKPAPISANNDDDDFTPAPLPSQETVARYQSFVSNTSDNEVSQVHQEYFNKMPKVQQMGLFSSLIDGLGGKQAVDPRQAGIRTTDPQQASPIDLGNLFNFAMNSGMLGGGGQQQSSGGLSGLAGLAGGLLGGGNNQQPQPNQSSGGLGGLIGGLLGGNNNQQPQYDNRQPQYNSQQPQYDNRQPYQQESPNYGSQASSGGGLEGILSNPLARAAISGLIAFGANKAMQGFAERDRSEPTQQPTQQYQQGNQNQPMSQNQPRNSNQRNSGGGSALPGFEDDTVR